MIKIEPAKRVQATEEYFFSKKLREIDKMISEGADIINLGIGSPDTPPPSKALNILSESLLKSDTHGYQRYNGIVELREAFAGWYQKYFSVTLSPTDEIVPLIGSKEGIMHTTLAFVNPGDGVLVPNPGYPTYRSNAQLAEAVVIPYELSSQNGWFPNLEELERRDLSNVKLMWVNYPHMPTGTNGSEELFDSLIDFGRRNQILICNDNPYSFILHKKRISILSRPYAKEIAIELNSVSKSHNMAGWRVGAVMGGAQFLSQIMKITSNIDSGMFRPIQEGVAEALNIDESWYNSLNSLYSKRRVVAEEIFEELGCSFSREQGGLFLWGEVPSRCADGFELSDKLLYGANLFVTPGAIFGDGGSRYIRISLCATEERLKEALYRVKEGNWFKS
ncbi:MAG: aminotransferase class I/II-fold pyridoxal phosphate-dependent enzyme [Bacteroidales bacterium]